MANTRVLIVEDESILAEGIEISLCQLGYVVVAKISSALGAVELARKHLPDVVLMDIMLKGEHDGIYAANEITSQLDIPVVFLTAYSDKSTLDRAKLTEPYGYVTKPFQDKDLRVAIDLAIYKHQQHKALKTNRNCLETTLKCIGDPVITTDRYGQVTFLNSVAQAITGWNEEDIIGQQVQMIFNIKDSVTYDRLPCPVAQVLETGETFYLEGRYLLTKKNGSTLPVGDSISAIRDESGNILGSVLVFQNLTWQEKADERIKDFLEELKRSNKQLSSFTATASHDLQEPLRKVIAFGELMKKSSTGLDAEQSLYMERIQDATRRMQEFIVNLQEFANVNTVKSKLCEPVDLGRVVSDVLHILDFRIKKSKALVHVGQLPTIEGNRFRLEQLFSNLISNALKFSKKGNAETWIKISSRETNDGKWEIRISDNGIGFSQVHAERIFLPFERLCGQSQYEGNGLGLSICKQIVEEHHGKISAVSSVGEGSTFTIVLPHKRPTQ